MIKQCLKKQKCKSDKFRILGHGIREILMDNFNGIRNILLLKLGVGTVFLLLLCCILYINTYNTDVMYMYIYICIV